ncbi:baseplate protein [Sodalis-like symbiont of Philaenus spumarius]|nr:baseplate protein [Sodalis-like symbiont of Philaenus spumarius]OZI14547.1 baseplate protein [Sodalis-like symbiont of Philaenus spumarius]
MNTSMSPTASDWQPALHAPGERVRGIEDIQQCLRLILGTPKGSDPHRPDFGSDLHRYLDMPTERALPHVVRETVEAIRRWEPRCELHQVTLDAQGERVNLLLRWRLPGSQAHQRTEVAWR